MRMMATVVAASALVLSGCGGEGADDNVLSETELGDVDVIEGTINDDMIQPDTLDAPEPPPEAAAPAADGSASPPSAPAAESEPAASETRE